MTFFIPHPPIPLLEIRVTDIALLLLVGCLWEVLSRGTALVLRKKSAAELQMDQELFRLQYETTQKRKEGMNAFVETSKLERQVLAKEKDLQKLAEVRQARVATLSNIIYKGGLALYLVVFLVYYSIPILKIDGLQVDDTISSSSAEPDLHVTEHDKAQSYLQGFLFPISYIGVGMRLARWGLPKSGLGALVVLWSSQVTVGKIMDGVEAMVLY